MNTSIAKRVVTVDAVIFNGRGDLLLIERKDGLGWALPGGVVEEDETVEEAVVREVQEETNAIWPDGFELRLLKVFSKPGRDPRGPTISVAFLGIVADTVHVRGGDDARKAEWVRDWKRRTLAFDHREIVDVAWNSTGLKRGPLPSPPENDDLPPVPLSFHQARALRDLYNGIGARRPRDNPSLSALARHGLVEAQEAIDGNKKTAHWTITEKGRARISS